MRESRETSPTSHKLLEGYGLHTGAPARVTLRVVDGPVALRAKGSLALISACSAVATERATTVEAPRGAFRIQTVEHAFAALAGLGVRSGVLLDIEGPEMPLLDGGSSAWCAALDALGLSADCVAPPPLRVERQATIQVGQSRYEFRSGDEVEVSVRFETDDARLEPDARWCGAPEDFRARIAPARTFALARDLEELGRSDLARFVDPEAVVFVGPDAIHCRRPFQPDEPARHKLLDLIGDLYLYGGPPVGVVSAVRPGHTATRRAVARAIDDGVLAHTVRAAASIRPTR
jgi:UDP-3-O-[3-hydroxymyristoyl] N-acetylglucosamine deacetylase